jgi:hypothetical protein
MEHSTPLPLQKYKYTPLLDEYSIEELPFRLLTLFPAESFSAPLEGSLVPKCLMKDGVEVTSLTEDYEALSYTWGNPDIASRIILHDDSFLPITSNLESFLRHRREKTEPTTLWIDAVCIDQSNLDERESQVSIMGSLYGAAPRLSIWLGPASSDSDLAIQELGTLACGTVYEKLPILESNVMESIASLLRRPWWKRVWIIQELYWGAAGFKLEEAIVRCGTKEISWMNLVLACASMEMNKEKLRQMFPEIQNVLTLDSVSSRLLSILPAEDT